MKGIIMDEIAFPAKVNDRIPASHRWEWAWSTVPVLLMFTWIFRAFIFGDKYLLFTDIGDDSLSVFMPVMAMNSDLLAMGNPDWSWRACMGQDVTFMGQQDPFTWLAVFAGKSNLPAMMIWVECMKVMVTSLFMHLFLRKSGLTLLVTVCGSLIFSMSGYMFVGMTGWYIFSTEVAAVAFSLWAAENFSRHPDVRLAAVVSFILGWMGFFLWIYLSFFIISYVILRRLELRERGNFFHMREDRNLLLGFWVGSLAAGYWLSNSVLQMLSSARVMTAGNLGISDRPFWLPAHEKEFIVTLLRLFSNSLPGSGSDYKGFWNIMEDPAYFMALPVLLFAFYFLIVTEKRTGKIWGTMSVIAILAIVFPVFRMAFWGFNLYYFRSFSFLLITLFFILGMRGFNLFLSSSRGRIFPILTAVLLGMVLFFLQSKGYATDVSQVMVIFSLLILWIIWMIFWRPDRPGAEWWKSVPVILIAADTGYHGNHEVVTRVAIDREYIAEGNLFNDGSLDIIRELQKQDESFFRINRNASSLKTSYYSLNDAMVQGYNGITGYSSFHSLSYIKFLELVGSVDLRNEESMRWTKDIIRRPALASFAGAKYFLIKGEQNLDPKYFEPLGEYGGYQILRSTWAQPLATVYDAVIPRSRYDVLSQVNKNYALFCAVVLSDSLCGIYRDMNLFPLTDTLTQINDSLTQVQAERRRQVQDLRVLNDQVTFRIDLTQPGIVLLTIPFDKGWKCEQGIPLFPVDGGLTGMYLGPGSHSVTLRFRSWLKTERMLLSGVGGIALMLMLIFGKGRNGRKKPPAELSSVEIRDTP